jgi:hypothetical protein
MAGRVRPSGSVNVPTEEQAEEARGAVEAAQQDIARAVDSVAVRLQRISNPVERAKAAAQVRTFASSEVGAVADEMFRAAVIEAYHRGRSEHGWYGYGALGDALGMSRARVQQVVNGSWKGKSKKDSEQVESLREDADRTRAVRRLAGSGYEAEQIAEMTGLSVSVVRDMSR